MGGSPHRSRISVGISALIVLLYRDSVDSYEWGSSFRAIVAPLANPAIRHLPADLTVTAFSNAPLYRTGRRLSACKGLTLDTVTNHRQFPRITVDTQRH